jgi:hypothetical protein
MEGRFGPEGSPFAGKFFAVTATNSTVYQITPNGRCTLFVSFDPQKGRAFGLAFPPGGRFMLVSMLDSSPPRQILVDLKQPCMNAHVSKDLDAHPLLSFWDKVTAGYGQARTQRSVPPVAAG